MLEFVGELLFWTFLQQSLAQNDPKVNYWGPTMEA